MRGESRGTSRGASRNQGRGGPTHKFAKAQSMPSAARIVEDWRQEEMNAALKKYLGEPPKNAELIEVSCYGIKAEESFAH